jgi:hypothetical protein
MPTKSNAGTVLTGIAIACAVAHAACGGSNDDASQFTPDAGRQGDDDGGVVRRLGGDDGGGATCAAQAHAASLAPLDLLVLLDHSGSMLEAGKWTSVTSAIGSFVAAPELAGVGVGLQYFPLTRLCAVDAYAAPDVEIAALPGSAAPIVASIDAHHPYGGTPMAPALEGAIQHAQAWGAGHPDRPVVVVLATDGIPDADCAAESDGGAPNTIAGVEQVAAAGLAGTPSVPTYVIGVGADLADLNAIAQAGGTGSAFLVDATSGTQAAFLAALESVRTKGASCRYAIDATSAGDPTKVNVRYVPASGAATDLVYVASVAGCGQTADGWYYDDPAHPTSVVLCADSCALAQGGGEVDVLFGCPTVTPK